ncbi:LysR substrate-binding domain-containing protein [Nocardioides sp. LHD-245]|uniref:LysR substrate-binding domain-containing protein n=1 Tax=Nocardioides sp. LHD-245 TaxID=3051387 RepID=UPI0027DF7F11|nr:LysR substrate-binding domain-containing protein [Nocardioides sp. LHD-245]
MGHPELLNGRLKIRHLVYVDTLAAAGSVVRAAERLHITQPVMTRALRELEEIVGVQLFARGARGISPTPYGTAFVDHARTVLAELRLTASHLAELADATTGTVTVGTYLFGSNRLLPMAIERLKRSRPRVTVVVRESNPEVLVTELLAGGLDLIVGRLTPLDDSSRLEQRVLYQEPVRLVARKGHPAAREPVPPLSALTSYPWVVPVAETALRRELEAAFLREGIRLPADRVECMSYLTTRHLMVHSDAIAALPEMITADDEQIALLPTPVPSLGSAVGLTEAQGRSQGPTAALFVECLDAVAAGIRDSAPQPPLLPSSDAAARPS